MYNNIGGKIKGLAKFFAWLGIILSILGGLGMAAAAHGEAALIIGGVVVAVIGALCSWIGSFVFYGYGQLIENSDKMVDQLRKIQ